MAHDFMAVKSYSGHEIMGDNRFLLAAAGGASTNPDSLSTTFTTLHASHPPPTHPPTRRAREGGRPNFLVVGGGWVGGCCRCFPSTPARAPGRCRAAAAARVRRRGPCQARQRSKTASGRRQPALHCVPHRCSTQQGTHRACVDPHRTGERGAAACASPRPESCSPAAKCMRARARNARCSPSLR